MHSDGKWRGYAILAAGLALLLTLQQSGPSSGNFGYTPNPEGTAAFLTELDRPLFSEAGQDAIANARGVNTLLYRAAYAAHQKRYGTPFVCGKQGIGDCVSFGWAHAIYIAQCVDWEDGQLAEPPLLPATESIYGGSRVEARGKDGRGLSAVGGYSDGSYGGAAARWCRDWGVIYRKDALATYSPDRAKAWGAFGNGGPNDNGRLDEQAKSHPCQHVALVRTFDEAAAAIESGYPVAVCSSAGFSSTRDADGFCRRQSTWMHCMVFISVRYGTGDAGGDAVDTSGRRGLLCLNSWGPTWVRGPKWPSDQPDGSFWVDEQTVNSMLRGGDSFAVGGVAGFKWRDLHHGEWLDEVRP